MNENSHEKLLERYDSLLERYERLLIRHDDMLEMSEFKDEEIEELQDDKETFIRFYHERFHTPLNVLENKVKHLLISMCNHNKVILETIENDIALILEYFMNQNLKFEHEQPLPLAISLSSVTCEYFYSRYVRNQTDQKE